MNRKDRRELGIKRGEWLISVPLGSPFAEGERMTIPGVAVLDNGTLVTDCARGSETALRVVVSRRPGTLTIIQA